MYESKSYQRHTEFLETANNQVYIDALYDENNPIYYYNNLFFKLIAPIANTNEQWLTVGDCTGIDAAFLKTQGVKATATDLHDKILSEIKAQGHIDNFDVQNVEKLTYADDTFDFVCCKEAYHHFPRPAIGFYEMLRVSKKGLILLEPNDINIDFAPLIFLRNLLDRFSTKLLRKLWKNQYSYETVGNFIDILINNAGLALGKDAFDDADMDDWDTMINTNVNGLLYTTRALLPLLKKAKGHIVNIGSTAGKEVYENGNVYCATKFAVNAISQSMRIDLVKHGIKVTAINPGAVETEFSIVRFKGNMEKANAAYLGYKPLVGMDVADTIYFACTLPAHVCINDLTITCTQQANSTIFHKTQ